MARDKNSGVLGAVANRENKRTAQNDAIVECASRGGGNCKVELAYTNHCIVTIQCSSAINNSRAPLIAGYVVCSCSPHDVHVGTML
ncbi:DUF4189 domain-containing protein [Lysobacter capsici]|uniref:DUF4189 domain-containing protein n=1 Tax=Lysobacter capsici TaxID=435897 RepID=UPI003CCE467C